MVNLKIDHIPVSVPEGTTIMEAADSVGIRIPSLCYLKEINEIAACRICIVEVAGKKKLIPSCNNVVQEGMEILTNSPKVREARRTNVQLILSQHDDRCAICMRSGNCNLQGIANDLGVTNNPFPEDWKIEPWNREFPLIRHNEKCIKCMRCVQICEKVQGMKIWDVINTGSRTNVGVAGTNDIAQSDCTLCGQCITHCPVGALHAREDAHKVLDALADPNVITVVQVAPAVRTAWAESFGLSPEQATPGRMAAALRRLGFDYVFDTTFTADLTIMEEGSEFLKRLPEIRKSGKPMFTSCCPGWVRFVKSQYPDMVDCLSSAKSPQQMFGTMVKTYFAEKIGADPKKIFSVSIMPCVAKKAEADLPSMHSSGEKDVDCVLTTRELARMIRSDRIIVERLGEENFDSIMGAGSGAGVIFGATGGVMEAALRSAYYLLRGKNPDADSFREVRTPGISPDAHTVGILDGYDSTQEMVRLGGLREAEFNLAGNVIRIAVVSGLGNTRRLLEMIRRGEVTYDFVEVMACPGGCVGGGGQPIHDGCELAVARGTKLYTLDSKNPMRFSHENPEVGTLYTEFLEKPLGEKSHKLLHTDHHAWTMPGEK